MKKSNNTIFLIIAIIVNVLTYTVNLLGGNSISFNYLISINLIFISISSYYFFTRKDFLNPVGLFFISWLLLVGVSQLKLSYYQQEWSIKAWVVILGSFIAFLLGYLYINIILLKYKKKSDHKIITERLFWVIVSLVTICILSLLIEINALKFVPLFSDDPGAYKKFSYKFFHYFVVLVAIVPSLTILYKSNKGKRRIWYINVISMIIPILIVSRQLLIFEVVTMFIVYHYCIKRFKLKTIFVVCICSIILFSASSVLRQQDSEYMFQASNFKDSKFASIAQAYMYFTMGFDNVNNLVNYNVSFDNGKRLLKGLELFTRVEINISNGEEYLVTPTFTAPTYLYALYLDFGVLGTLIAPFLIGVIVSLLYERRESNNLNIVIYSMILYCLLFSFFVNWYYNTTIILFLVVTILIKFLVTKNKSRISIK
ncbi:O-antigen polymerase [Neobacillus sp. BF23-41]|uniref:O-antigen polymerase n=1 Tax=Neobacillus sp. BF23-41 TaxID=3240280 RepID=UPI0034E514A5